MQLEAPRWRLRPAAALHLPRIDAGRRALTLAATGAVGAFALAIYLTTLAPTVMWYDMGEFVTASATLGIAHNTGYPLLILLGKAFTYLPVGDTAYRVNLLSAVCTAAAIAVTFGVIHDLTDDLAASAIGALTLAFGATVWANATWATSYGLNLLFTALVTRFMFSWWRDRSPRALIAAALTLGLAMCNHRIIVLVAPPSAVLLALGWRSLRARDVSIAVGAFAVGLSVYAYLPIRAEQHPVLSWAQPANWHTYWAMFMNGQTPSSYWRFDLADRIDVLWVYPSYDLTWAGLALALLGLVVCAARSRAIAAYLVVLLALDALVVETYSIHNIYNYLTPGYFALCVLVGVAAAWTIASVRRAPALGAPMPPWARAACLATLLALLPVALLMRNQARVDRSGDYSALDFAQQTLAALPPRAVVLTDSWSASPLWYVQLVQGERHDVTISPIFSVPGEDVGIVARKQFAEGRAVYVAEGLRTPLDDLKRDFTLQPVLTGGIERMIVDVLPQPRYRDDLVMSGTLFRVWPEAPDVRAASVPAGAARDVAFANGVTLAGVEGTGVTVARGDVVQFTYYWRADAHVGADLSAATLFFDAANRAQQTRGIPAWSQSRIIGQGALQTSRWQPGELVRESYFSVVPRSLAAGEYTVRIAVFDATGDQATARADAQNLVTIGTVTVR